MHSVSTSPSHCPGSGQEPLCWHGAFERSRPNKREKRALPAWKHRLSPILGRSGLPTPHLAPGGLGWAREVFLHLSNSGNYQKPQTQAGGVF